MSARWPLGTLDLVGAKLHQAARPFDFAAIVELDSSELDLGGLRTGALSSRHLFPTSGAKVLGREWVWQEPDTPLVEHLVVADEAAQQKQMQAAVDEPMDPHHGPPIRQLWIEEEATGKARLLTRFHHAAFDGLSVGLWLLHQLMVATERCAPETETAAWEPPRLKRHPAPVRKSRFAPVGPSTRLWSPSQQPSPSRRWASFDLDAARFRSTAASMEGVTYNDLLSAAALESFTRWNRFHGAREDKMGLWLPMNIRAEPLCGFGNAASRIRVYGHSTPESTWTERAQSIRSQVRWSKEHGEWSVPEENPILGLPDWLMTSALRAFLARPWVDMGSSVFTHLEQLGAAAELLPMVRSTDWVLMLHKWYPAGLAAATLGDTTRVSMTWDPNMLPPTQAAELLALVESVFNEAGN